MMYKMYITLTSQTPAHRKVTQVAALLKPPTYEAIKAQAEKDERSMAFIVRTVLEERFGT